MPADIRAELGRQLAPYRKAHPGVRWTRPQTWHLTLLFLGSVVPDRVSEVARLVDEVAGTTEPYQIVIDAGDGRTRRDDGVAWLVLGDGAGMLIETADLVARRCPHDITDGPLPRRTPSAHLTVVRRADADVITALRERARGPLGVSWTIDRIQLVRSHLEAGDARYQTLHEATM